MKVILTLFVILTTILFAQQIASAQDSYVPTFDNESAVSLHYGFGKLMYEIDFGDSVFDDTEQDVTTIGISFEKSIFNGFFNWRFGSMHLGDTTIINENNIRTLWDEYQKFSIYSGFGYIYMKEMSLSYVNLDPDLSQDRKNPHEYTFFFGGGFDINIYAQFAEKTTPTHEYKWSFYLMDFSLVGIAGIRTPFGLIIHISLSANFVMDWEYRYQAESYTQSYSDRNELSIPLIGIQTGVSYNIPFLPSFRLGFLVNFIDSSLFILHVGYLF